MAKCDAIALCVGNESESTFIKYHLYSNSLTSDACVTCTFLDSNTTACVVVVQLSSSELTRIESSHKFTRSGNKASGCIEGVNLSSYLIGVIGGI